MARITIASLTADNAKLNAELRQAGLQLEALRLELSIAKANAALPKQAAAKPEPVEFAGYWDYVRAVKKWSYATNTPVSYKSQAQWHDAHQRASADYDSYMAGEREWLTAQAERNGTPLPN